MKKKEFGFYGMKSKKNVFSIIDVVGVLSESDNPGKYWSVRKTRLKAEDGKMRLTDVTYPGNLKAHIDNDFYV